MKRTMIALVILLAIIQVQAQEDYVPFSGFLQAESYTVEVLNTYLHDPTAFTQGLIWEDGVLYESTGLRGQSSLRRVDLTTGEVLQSVSVSRSQEELDAGTADYFAEGLELVDGRLIQLTWQEGLAFVYDAESFEQVDTFEYNGEGWGLCDDGRYLYMSDSTQYLAIRERDSFELVGRMLVTVNASPLQAGLLNELECVGDTVYANLWQTDYIVQIDKFSGNVTQVIDAAGLLTDEMIRDIPNFFEDVTTGTVRPPSGAVLNGIAYNPETDTFFITGKLWSRLFEVRFVPVE